MKNDPVLWASQIPPPSAENFLHEDWDSKLAMACHTMNTSEKARSLLADEQQLLSVCRWLIEALYQAHCSFPPVPVAIQQSSGSFSKGKVLAPPFGYRITKLVLDAAVEAAIVDKEKGFFNPTCKGKVSRFSACNRLKTHFIELEHCWQYVSPLAKEKSILIAMAPKGKSRRYANSEDSASIRTMQKNLLKINTFLAKQCIYIDLPNSILLKGIKASQVTTDEAFELNQDLSNGIAINFQNVFLRRIFAQRFDQGGRFYGGWWQCVKKNLRSRIVINEYLTSECDFSSLSLRMLYAMEQVDCGEGDLYDLGVSFPNDPDTSRDIVKRYINALLNDASKKYQLDKEDLKYLSISRKELFDAVCERHSLLRKYFYSGIGLQLQFMDSKMAEHVMLHFVNINQVCLPIHDSFIVRRGLENELQIAMKFAFEKYFAALPKLKLTSGYDGFGFQYFDKSIPSQLLAEAVEKHMDDYSIMRLYFSSWEHCNFTEEQMILRERYFDQLSNR